MPSGVDFGVTYSCCLVHEISWRRLIWGKRQEFLKIAWRNKLVANKHLVYMSTLACAQQTVNLVFARNVSWFGLARCLHWQINDKSVTKNIWILCIASGTISWWWKQQFFCLEFSYSRRIMQCSAYKLLMLAMSGRSVREYLPPPEAPVGLRAIFGRIARTP